MAYERKTVDILISEELKEILKEIESESIVAYKLLRKRHRKEDVVNNPVNYISISSQDKTRISYLTSDRLESIPKDEYWTSTRRYHAKPGSFIGKVFKDVSQKEVEKFSNLFRTESLKPKFTFKVINGNDIKKYYRYDSYAEDGRGSLGISCMKHESCQKLLDIYTKNKKVISMLIMLNEEGYLMGRALLWDSGSNKIMDRIYTQDDEKLQFHFKKWASKNGYLYKSEQNWFNTLFFEKIGSDKKELKLEIELNTNHQYLPYMDTFKFIGVDSGKLYNYIPDGVSVKTLCACDGGRFDWDYLRFDSIDRVFRYRGEAPYLNYLNIYTHERNLNWSNVNDSYILREHAKYSEELDDYIFNEEFDTHNNKSSINDRLNYLEQRRKERAERDKMLREQIESVSGGEAFVNESSSAFSDYLDNISRTIFSYSPTSRRSRRGARTEESNDNTPLPNEEL